MSPSLKCLNGAATALHLAQAIVVFALTLWLDSRNVTVGIFPLHKTVHVWHKANFTQRPALMGHGVYIEAVVQEAGTLDVRYVIASFFALSAGFQGAAGYWDVMDPYFRFIEYAFSASTMLLAIGVEAGVDDIYTLQAMFVLVFATMLFGIVAELSCTRSLAWIAHAGGWLTFLSAYSPVLDSFLLSSARSTAAAPGFVHVIVFLQFVLFACFGGVQAYALLHQSPMRLMDISRDIGRIDEEEEEIYYADSRPATNMAYIILSLTAKTILAWLILSPVLAAA